MRIALVHDHLNQIGGAERVLKNLTEIFPKSPIYTLICDHHLIGDFFLPSRIHSSFIQKLPWSIKHLRWYLGMMPAAIERIDVRQYDVVISDASAFAKGVLVRPGAVHICYCHTPTRYLWSDANSYTEELKHNAIIKKVVPFILTWLRMWDYVAAQRVDHFIANSHFVAQRIQKYYNRESQVIYPPVDTHLYQPSFERDGYYIIIARLKAYKRVDIAIEAFNELKIPLVVVGSGEEEKNLKKIAKSHIKFTGQVSETEKRKLIAHSLALIQPQEEDFGITAVEAMASGKPVIAYKAGGFLETIIHGETGLFFEVQSWESLAHTILQFEPSQFDPIKINAHTTQFSKERFAKEMTEFVQKTTHPIG